MRPSRGFPCSAWSTRRSDTATIMHTSSCRVESVPLQQERTVMASASPLTLTLTPEQRPGSFTLTCGTVTAPIEFRAEALADLLRRLQPVLVGGRDPAGQLTPLALLREVGPR